MKRSIASLAGACLALVGCPSDPGNPKTLWLATANQMETMIHLIDHEPRPF